MEVSKITIYIYDKDEYGEIELYDSNWNDVTEYYIIYNYEVEYTDDDIVMLNQETFDYFKHITSLQQEIYELEVQLTEEQLEHFKYQVFGYDLESELEERLYVYQQELSIAV